MHLRRGPPSWGHGATAPAPSNILCLGHSCDSQVNVGAACVPRKGRGAQGGDEAEAGLGHGGQHRSRGTPLPTYTGTPRDALSHPPAHLPRVRDAPVRPQQDFARFGACGEAESRRPAGAPPRTDGGLGWRGQGRAPHSCKDLEADGPGGQTGGQAAGPAQDHGCRSCEVRSPKHGKPTDAFPGSS